MTYILMVYLSAMYPHLRTDIEFSSKALCVKYALVVKADERYCVPVSGVTTPPETTEMHNAATHRPDPTDLAGFFMK